MRMKICLLTFTLCILMTASRRAQEVAEAKTGDQTRMASDRKAPVPLHCQVLSTSGKPVAGAKMHVSHMASRDQDLDEPKIAEGESSSWEFELIVAEAILGNDAGIVHNQPSAARRMASSGMTRRKSW